MYTQSDLCLLKVTLERDLEPNAVIFERLCRSNMQSFTDIFNVSLVQEAPKLWKETIILLVPKNKSPKELNYF